MEKVNQYNISRKLKLNNQISQHIKHIYKSQKAFKTCYNILEIFILDDLVLIFIGIPRPGFFVV